MNLAEKLAATYLRLNGFLVIPHFTAFDGRQHNHIDIVGLRAPRSQEVVGSMTLPTDDKLFNNISNLIGRSSREVPLGIAVEARTNENRDEASDEHISYVSKFLGGIPVIRLAFFDGEHTVHQSNQCIDVGLNYAGLWIQGRIDWMLAPERNFKLTKTGSWNWSESFLSDFLGLRKFDLLTSNRSPLP